MAKVLGDLFVERGQFVPVLRHLQHAEGQGVEEENAADALLRLLTTAFEGRP